METAHPERSPVERKGEEERRQNDLAPILQLRGKERMEAILSSDDPKAIFQSLPEEEAYLTIKEIGEEGALPLLSLMSSEQCQYLLDLELWKGYDLEVQRLERWLPLLLSCEEEALERWLRSLDLDTLLLILKKTIRVHVKDGDVSPSSEGDEKTPFSLDGSYSIEVLHPSLQNSIEQLLRHLAALDLNLYWRVLHQVEAEIRAELEERAFHFREARLEDKGFPPMEEALSLYQYLTPKRLRRMLEEKEIYLPPVPDETPVPHFPMVLTDQKMFFSLCLREVEANPIIDRLKMELSYMANQVMVADRVKEIDVSTLYGSLNKVAGYLSIGLELLSEGNREVAKGWIEQVPLKFIFQVGYGATLELKWRAEKVWQKPWFVEKGLPLSFLGSPWEERVGGLLKRRPLFYDESGEMGYREFRSLDEVRSLHRDLDKVEVLGRVILSLPPFSYSDGLTWKSVLWRAYVEDREELSRSDPSAPLTERSSWLKKLRRERREVEASLTRWLLQRLGPSQEAVTDLLREIASLVLEEMDSSCPLEGTE